MAGPMKVAYRGSIDGVINPSSMIPQQETGLLPQQPSILTTIDVQLRNLVFANGRKLTDDEIIALLGIKWSDGTVALTLENGRFTYEIVTAAIQDPLGVANACDRIKDFTSVTDKAIYRTQGTKVILLTYIFSKEHKEYIADIGRIKNAIDVIEGTEQCPHCGSWKTNKVELQLRSADEPTTKICRCHACGHGWTF